MSIADTLPHLAVAWLAYFIAVISPGPATLALISTSMTRGRAAGMAFALGVMTGSLTWACASAIGLAAVMASYAEVLIVLKIAGGLYLLYLAWKSFRSAMTSGDLAEAAKDGGKESLRRLYLKGLGLHLTNPKAVLAWISLISLGLPMGAPASMIAFYIAGCFLIGLVSLNGMAVLFSLPPVVALYRRGRRGIDGVMGAFFAFAGVKLLTARL
ncbi:threonine/homoserine/homoserine lactone efflux protein [Rhizobium sp. SG_E_25_P2]|uniref:LysE family translocator n=1 Tax=Rhizobium sp. SG_E_25_P2 TaxID=2879942 RepID=UPI002474033F|nr:LysE family translocator [Rhizobium sp. SG_E_25_P2]MDH6267728.1 threonine/homoserine/homoserine lactone efflux protein [Rhizobium sp. SG_E_25_P2]